VSTSEPTEREWQTRKQRMDPKLDACGWPLPPSGTTPLKAPYRSEEEPTDSGPADYALWSDNKCVGIVEAKKVAMGPKAASPRRNGTPVDFGTVPTTSKICTARSCTPPMVRSSGIMMSATLSTSLAGSPRFTCRLPYKSCYHATSMQRSRLSRQKT
jgi:hypothetical protein